MADSDRKSPCVFCGKRGQKHKEDILPKWIASEFPDLKWEIRSVETERAFVTRRQLGLVSRAPCKQCNNNWMSQLESEARPILAPLMHGKTSVLTIWQQLVIIRWFLKTSMMYEFLDDTGTRYFTPEERKIIMSDFIMPGDTQFFLGRYAGQHDIVTRSVYIPLLIGTNTNNARMVNAYSSTFAIKQLALQIFSFRRGEKPKRDIFMNIPYNWSEVTVQIWPPVGNVRWPPPVPLRDKSFEIFAERWNDPPLPPSRR